MHTHSYLALGDSYTIGESIPLHLSFPYQLVQQLRSKGQAFTAPEIIARTGWTTEELDAALQEYQFLPKYDFVTLLAGVNNQYRGQELMAYKQGFEELIRKAIHFAHNKKEHVIILSIPDYGYTPHGQTLDPEKISKEIEVFNSVNRALSIQYKVQYVDITPGTRQNDPALLAGDGLHPSAQAYGQWAGEVAAVILAALK